VNSSLDQPIRFVLRWRGRAGEPGQYTVSVPELLPNHGDELAVREDKATPADAERAKRATMNPSEFVEPLPHEMTSEWQAHAVLAAVFGEPEGVEQNKVTQFVCPVCGRYLPPSQVCNRAFTEPSHPSSVAPIPDRRVAIRRSEANTPRSEMELNRRKLHDRRRHEPEGEDS
jgi:hypothetical protein